MSVAKSASLAAEIGACLSAAIQAIAHSLPLELQTKGHILDHLAQADAAAQSLSVLASVLGASAEAISHTTATPAPQAPLNPVS